MERTVQFLNEKGLSLSGIIHTPTGAKDGMRRGVLFLNSGLGQRNYSHSLYVSLARRLTDAGYYVLRFDFHGLGESDGDFESQLYIEWYNDIQNGMFVSDVAAAAGFFRRECGLNDVILLGICGGAITGLLAAAREELNISGSILIGLPITMDKPDRPYAEEMTTAKAKLTMSGYLARLVSPGAWWRLITLKSDFRTIFRSAKALATSCLPKGKADNDTNWTQLVTHPAFNPHVIPSFQSCLKKKRPLQLIFAECDRLRWEFESEFQDKCLRSDNEYSDRYEIVVIGQTNHEFQFPASKLQLGDQIIGWLERRFSVGG